MKYMIFSDTHLHTWRRFGHDPETGLSRRLREQQDVLKQILDIQEKEKPDYTICGGDVFHKVGEIPIECINIANKFPTLWERIVPGNHDLIDIKNPKWFHFSGHIIQKDRTLPKSVKLIGYTDEINYDEIKDYELVIAHKVPVGCCDGSWVFDEGADWRRLRDQNGIVLFGHIHQHQKLGERCWVIGSPMPFKFGDIGERGVLIVEDADVRFIKLRYPEFITVDSWADVKDEYNYYRVQGSDRKSDKQNVIAVTKPKFHEERVKADTFSDILKEWVEYNDVNDRHLDVIHKVVGEEMLIARNLYKGRLKRVIVKNFMSGSQEVRRIMTRYIKDWCPNMKADALAVANHERFYKDTEQMFSLVLQRIQDETEKLYPLIRKLSGNMDHAA